MVIQVITREIGEYAHVEAAPIHPALFQGVGGHLHDHPVCSGVDELADSPLQVNRFGSGVGCGYAPITESVTDGPEDCRRDGGLSQDRLNQVGGGCLAIGTRDPHKGNAGGRVAEKGSCSMGHGATCIADPQPRHVAGRPRRILKDDRNGARRLSGSNELMTV